MGTQGVGEIAHGCTSGPVIDILFHESDIIIVFQFDNVVILDQNQTLKRKLDLQEISCAAICKDAINCDSLLVGEPNGNIQIYNIRNNYKGFCTIWAYNDEPASKILPLLEPEKGFVTASDRKVTKWTFQIPITMRRE